MFRAQAQRFSPPVAARYDIVFLDPPFAADWWTPAAQALLEHGRLEARRVVVCRIPGTAGDRIAGATGRLHREGHAGAVRYALYRRFG